MNRIIFLVWSIALTGLVAYVLTENRSEHQDGDKADVKAEQGLAAGRDIKIEKSQINILAPPVEPTATDDAAKE